MKTDMLLRRSAAAVLSLLLCLSLSFPALAAKHTEEPTPEEPAYRLTLTLRTAEDLLELAEQCSLDSWSRDVLVVLNNDISLSGIDFLPIPSFGGTLEGGGHTVSTLLNAHKIKKHDPEFSSEYFRDKVISLFRMAVYSKDAAELACCQCRCPESAADIIEAQLFNFNINSCKITDGVCDADLTLYLDCLHYKKGKVISQSDKFRMHVRKRIRASTDLGFSFAAVSCPSCGASFDARNVKACPFCSNAYRHEEHDWILTDLQ